MISKELTTFVADLKYDDLSEEVIDMTKKCIGDFIGAAISGCNDPASQIWFDYLSNESPKNEATIWQPGFPKTYHLYAACVNSAFGHVLDLDDVHSLSIMHNGAVTIPVAIALGELLQKSTKDIILAIVAGYEVGARVGQAVNPAAYWYWHTTGTVGNFAAAVTAGKMLNLTAKQMYLSTEKWPTFQFKTGPLFLSF